MVLSPAYSEPAIAEQSIGRIHIRTKCVSSGDSSRRSAPPLFPSVPVGAKLHPRLAADLQLYARFHYRQTLPRLVVDLGLHRESFA
jgi:hypothetical protein